jgi:WD40 repeat protein
VGPQAYKVSDAWRFFGRDREAADLIDIVAASRIVLLYSPSGAGKSSLINAAVIPQFPKRFRVLPVISVGGVSSPSPDGVPGNRYVGSAVRSIENALPEAERLPASELAGMPFASYLARRRELVGDDHPELMIFDQFEEILAIDPFDLDAKTEFFEQVGEALRDRQRWAIFSMREEYDAQLDPYRRLVPTGLSTRFRLDLLGTDAAIEAVWRPTRDLPVKITEGAAKKVVADLSQIKIEQDGKVVTRQGLYVDPVQLQVVCLRLWQKRPPDTTEITADYIDRTGTNVDVALAEYYGSTVADASSETGVPERPIRAWIGDHLITRHGNRNRVLREPGESRGLDDRVIAFLIDRYLLRTVPGDATWVELAHDRLVQPVRESNETWFRDNLSPLQRHAEAWDKGGRSQDLLLPVGLLKEARTWSEQHSDLVTPTEQQFLARSEEARAHLVWRRVVPAAAVLILLLVALAGWALLERGDKQKEATAASEARATADVARATAESQADLSRVRALAAQAPDQHDAGDDERGALLALQAYAFSSEGNQPAWPPVDEALRTVLGERHFSIILDNVESVLSVALSPDGRTLAAASAVGTGDDAAVRIRLWNLMDAGAEPVDVRGPDGLATVLAFSPDGATLAVGVSDGVQLADTATGQPLGETLSSGRNIRAIVFSPDSSMLAMVVSAPLDAKSNIQVWDIRERERRWEPVNIGGAGSVIAFTPDGASLAVSTDEGIGFVDTATGDVRSDTLPTESGVTAIAFSADGRTFAVASGPSGTVRLWTLADETPESTSLDGQESSVAALAFSRDDQMLVAGHTDGTVQLWSTTRPEADPIVLRGHVGGVRTVAFSADGEVLATGSDDRTVRLWHLGPAAAEPSLLEEGEPGGGGSAAIAVAFSPDGTLWRVSHDDGALHQRNLSNPEDDGVESFPRRGGGEVSAVAISADGRMLAAGSANGTVQVWADGKQVPGPADPRRAGSTAVSALAFNPDGTVLAIGGADGTVRLWSAEERGRDIVLRIPGVTVTAIAFSPDGGRLVVSGSDRRVRTWDLKQPATEPDELRDNSSETTALAIGPDGTTFATGDIDGTVRLWIPENPEAPVVVLLGPGSPVSAMTFSPDGAILVTAHADGSVRSWIVRTDVLAGMVCQLVHRNLTQEEWDQFVGAQVPYQSTCENLPPGEGTLGAGTSVASPVSLRRVAGAG